MSSRSGLVTKGGSAPSYLIVEDIKMPVPMQSDFSRGALQPFVKKQ